MGIRSSKLKNEQQTQKLNNQKKAVLLSDYQDKYKDDLEDAVNLVMAMQGERNTINIELSLACQDLPNADLFSLSDPIIHVFLEKADGWVKVGSTEPIFDTLNPIFTEKVLVSFNAQQKQKIKFEVYDIDKLKDKDLTSKSKKLGYTETELSEIIYKDVWESPLKSDNRRYKGGIIKVQAIESDIGQSKIWFTFELYEFMTAHHILFTISGANNSNQFFSLYKSNPQKNTSKGCFFEPFRMTSNQINSESSNLKFEFYEYKNGRATSVLGELNISLLGLYNAKNNCVDVFKNNLVVGKMKIASVDKDNNESFFNYIYAGYTIKTIFALDLSITKANDEAHLNNKDFIQIIEELNIRKPNTNREKCFEVYFDPLIKLTTIMNYFNDTTQLPVYGLGARLPPLHDIDCNLFSLTENIFNPFFENADLLIETIKNKVIDNQKFKSSNVSFYKEIAEFCNGLARCAKEKEEKTYIVCLILTNHYPNDVNQFLHELKAGHDLPISFIICNVHNFDDIKFNASKVGNNFGIQTKKEDKYEWIVKELQRQNLRENLHWFKCKSFEDDIESLTRNVLSLIPVQFCEYMKMNNIKPKGVDKKGNQTRTRGIKKELLNMLETRKTKKNENNIIRLYLNKRKANLISHLKEIDFDDRLLSLMDSQSINIKIPSENINIINQVLTHIEFYERYTSQQPIIIEELQYEYNNDKSIYMGQYNKTLENTHLTHNASFAPIIKKSTFSTKIKAQVINRSNTKMISVSNKGAEEGPPSKILGLSKMGFNLAKSLHKQPPSSFNMTAESRPIKFSKYNNQQTIDGTIATNSSNNSFIADSKSNVTHKVYNTSQSREIPTIVPTKNYQTLITEKIIFEKIYPEEKTNVNENKSEQNSRFLEEVENRHLKFLKESLPNDFYKSIENSFIKNKTKKNINQVAQFSKVLTPLDKYLLPKAHDSKPKSSQNAPSCLNCYMSSINIIFMNCGHAMYCENCYLNRNKTERCEICKLPIDTVYRTEVDKKRKTMFQNNQLEVTNVYRQPSHISYTNGISCVDDKPLNENAMLGGNSKQYLDDCQSLNNLTNEPDQSFGSFEGSYNSIEFEDDTHEEKMFC